MDNLKALNGKSLIFMAVSLLMCCASLSPKAEAATFTAQTSWMAQPSSDSFEQLEQEFLVNNLLSIDSLSSQTAVLDTSIDRAQELKALKINLLLSQADSVTRSALTFGTVVNSFKQLKFTFNDKQELEVRTLAQAGFSDVYEGVYEFQNLNGRRSPIERLVGDYLTFNPGVVSETVLPKTYYYNKNSVGIGIANATFAGLPSGASLNSYLAGTTGDINSPSVQEGLQLNRVRPEEDDLDSTLQLWPRNPLSLEVKGYGGGSSSGEIAAVQQFGHLNPTVNLPLMPKDILVNQLDLEVDWVNEGEYSNNLRANVERISEHNRASQEEFQSNVEQWQSENYRQQQEYQRQLQTTMSINFQRSSYQQQKNRQTPGLSRYNTPRTNLNLTPRN